MKTPIFFTDLTQRPPRSFRVRLGNFVILARMLDKGRATLELDDYASFGGKA